MLKAELQIARHHAGDAIVVEADQLAQERDRQQRLSALAAFLLDDDLGEYRMGQVVAIFGVVDHEITVGADHLGQVFKRDVGACFSIVETAVGILLNDHRVLLGNLSFCVAEHR